MLAIYFYIWNEMINTTQHNKQDGVDALVLLQKTLKAEEAVASEWKQKCHERFPLCVHFGAERRPDDEAREKEEEEEDNNNNSKDLSSPETQQH